MLTRIIGNINLKRCIRTIREYHNNVLDHYESPRNVGSFGKNEKKHWDRISWCTSMWRCDEATNQS